MPRTRSKPLQTDERRVLGSGLLRVTPAPFAAERHGRSAETLDGEVRPRKAWA